MENIPPFNGETNEHFAQTGQSSIIRCDEKGCIYIEGEFTIHEAEYLHHALLDLLREDRDQWTLNLSGITNLDIAGVQILISLKKTARDIRVHSCPNSIRLYLDQLGLAAHLL